VLERSGKSLPFVPCLFLAVLAGNVVVAAGRDCSVRTELGSVWTDRSSFACVPVAKAAEVVCGESLAFVAAGLLDPPVTAVPIVSASSYLRLLPAVPRPIVMVLVGFLCISVVHDRKSWVAMAAFLLSLGHGWLSMVQPGTWQHRRRRLARDVLSCVPAAVPTGRLSVIGGGHNLLGFLQLHGIGKPRRDVPAAAVNPRDVLRCFGPRGAFHVPQLTHHFVYLTLAQLARGPPRSP